IDVSDADLGIYQKLRERRRMIAEPHLSVRGDGDLRDAITHIRQALTVLLAGQRDDSDEQVSRTA
ncbi:MAG: hypothetical protein M1296_04350, partial [Chloroflexi bacterium]|nr:hypothetical protein [Chloroflexota bacterium]